MCAMTLNNDQTLAEVTTKLSVELMDNLQDIAATKGTDIQIIINNFLEEGVQQSMSKVKRKRVFLPHKRDHAKTQCTC